MSLTFSYFAMNVDGPSQPLAGEFHYGRVCDFCERYLHWSAPLTLRTKGKTDFDFCSMRCLAIWAGEMEATGSQGDDYGTYSEARAERNS